MEIKSLILKLALLTLLSLIIGNVARKRNKSFGLWTVLGFLFGIFALILLQIIYYKEKRFEKKKNKLLSPVLPKIPSDDLMWYYLKKDNSHSDAISGYRLYELYNRGFISKDSYVWNEKLETWKRLNETELFNKYFSPSSPIS